MARSRISDLREYFRDLVASFEKLHNGVLRLESRVSDLHQQYLLQTHDVTNRRRMLQRHSGGIAQPSAMSFGLPGPQSGNGAGGAAPEPRNRKIVRVARAAIGERGERWRQPQEEEVRQVNDVVHASAHEVVSVGIGGGQALRRRLAEKGPVGVGKNVRGGSGYLPVGIHVATEVSRVFLPDPLGRNQPSIDERAIVDIMRDGTFDLELPQQCLDGDGLLAPETP